jgi:NitT/TauT family transport system permease protein
MPPRLPRADYARHERGRNSSGGRRIRIAFLGIGLLLILWQAASAGAGSALILPSPLAVFHSFLALLSRERFWRAVGGSLSRIIAAFVICIAAGSLTGLAAGLNAFFRALIAPLLTTIRATPVLALILLAMFWFPSGIVPVFSGCLMAFPVMHTAMEAGIRAVDPSLIQMARLFEVPRTVMIRKLWIPAAAPQLRAGTKNVLGLCWKVVVAGEVLSQPRFALGSGMQESRLMLETPEVFAWAAVTVLLCGLSEYILGLGLAGLRHRGRRSVQGPENPGDAAGVRA